MSGEPAAGPPWRAAATTLVPLVLGMAAAVAVTAWFHGRMPDDLDHTVLAGAFHRGHIWCVDHVQRMVLGEEPRTVLTDRAGFPGSAAARCLLLVPAVVTTPLRAVYGPLGAYNLLILATPAAAVLAAWALARRITDLSSAGAAAVGVVYAVSPFVLGSFAGGQVCKAQVWTIPACLWALTWAVRGPRRPLGVIAAAALGAATAYTEPTFALIVPLVAAPWALLAVQRPLWRSALGAATGLGALAAGLWTAKLYYDTAGSTGIELFEPANRLTSHGIPLPAPMAQPWPTLLGPRDLQLDPGAPNHITYLGLPLVGAMLVGSLFRWKGRSFAWLAVAVGITFALGELLVSDNAYVTTAAGQKYALPAFWLAAKGYPLARSVMYYRVIAVASLGVAVGAMGVTSRLRYGGLLACALAGAAVWDSHRVLAPIWPAKSALVNEPLYSWLAADPTPGALVELPLVHNARTGAAMVLDSVFVDRPTTALVRFAKRDQPNVVAVNAWLSEAAALPPAEASAAMFAHGVRYILSNPADNAPEVDAVTQTFGRPLMIGGRFVWRMEALPATGGAPGTAGSAPAP